MVTCVNIARVMTEFNGLRGRFRRSEYAIALRLLNGLIECGQCRNKPTTHLEVVDESLTTEVTGHLPYLSLSTCMDTAWPDN